MKNAFELIGHLYPWLMDGMHWLIGAFPTGWFSSQENWNRPLFYYTLTNSQPTALYVNWPTLAFCAGRIQARQCIMINDLVCNALKLAAGIYIYRDQNRGGKAPMAQTAHPETSIQPKIQCFSCPWFDNSFTLAFMIYGSVDKHLWYLVSYLFSATCPRIVNWKYQSLDTRSNNTKKNFGISTGFWSQLSPICEIVPFLQDVSV